MVLLLDGSYDVVLLPDGSYYTVILLDGSYGMVLLHYKPLRPKHVFKTVEKSLY